MLLMINQSHHYILPPPFCMVINLCAAVSNASDFPKVRLQSYDFFSIQVAFRKEKTTDSAIFQIIFVPLH